MKNKKRKHRHNFIKILMLISITVSLLQHPVYAAPGYDQVAAATSQPKSILKDGMTPIHGSNVTDGIYEVEASSSSAFFKIVRAELTVKDGEMSAVLWMSSNSYTHVYLGTAREAAAAPESDYIPLEKGDGESSFTIPVKWLNEELSLASFSKKRQMWYDRSILFDASSLPEESVLVPLPEEVQQSITPVEMNGKDGEYSIEVGLTGGSGRASVTSPTWFYIRDGKAYAKLLWSSSYYDYMMVGDTKYENETTDGSNSSFTIPVTAFDEPMTVVADNTSMGDAVEIEYTLTFYEDTIGGKGQIPQEAAKKVLCIALGIIVVGGILNHFVKKRRYH